MANSSCLFKVCGGVLIVFALVSTVGRKHGRTHQVFHVAPSSSNPHRRLSKTSLRQFLRPKSTYSKQVQEVTKMAERSDAQQHNFKIFFPTDSKPVLNREGKFQSQKGQDRWVVETLSNYGPRWWHERERRYYVDLAANHPVTYSNTKYMDDVGWDGVCIEGNMGYIRLLKQQRSAICVHAVVDACGGLDVPWASNLGDHGGVVGEEFHNREAGDDVDVVVRKTTTLEQILDAVRAPMIIDYLNLDVEGGEYRVLQNFPFDRYTFLTVTVERPAPWLNRLLLENGYIWLKNDQGDSFYVRKSISAPRPDTELEQLPPKQMTDCGKFDSDCDWPEQGPAKVVC